jgi:hypothetical protein
MSELEASLTTTHEFSSFVWKQTSGLKVRRFDDFFVHLFCRAPSTRLTLSPNSAFLAGMVAPLLRHTSARI